MIYDKVYSISQSSFAGKRDAAGGGHCRATWVRADPLNPSSGGGGAASLATLTGRRASSGFAGASFLHVTTGPDNTNNALALAFGAFIVGTVIAGSVWIMAHLNGNMSLPPAGPPMDLRMQ